MLCGLLWLASVIAATPASAQTPPLELPPPAPNADVDPALAELDQRLADLEAGTLSTGISVAQLFSVPLDDLAVLARRRDELTREVEELESRLAQLERDIATPKPIAPAALATPDPVADPTPGVPAPTDPQMSANAQTIPGVRPPKPVSEPVTERAPNAEPLGAPNARAPASESASTAAEGASSLEAEARALRIEAEREARAAELAAFQRALREWENNLARARSEAASLKLRRSISARRLRFLARWMARLEALPTSARGVLRSLELPRSALREHSGELRLLAATAASASTQLELLAASASRGALVGFVGDRRYLQNRLPSLAASLLQRGEALASRAETLSELATEFETRGAQLRRLVWLTTARADPSDELDQLFLQHLRAQRSLRAGLRETASTSSDSGEVRRFTTDLSQILPSAYRVGTTDEAEVIAEGMTHALEQLDRLLDTTINDPVSWQLAFENDLVALLAATSSRRARQEGYAWSRELIEDVQAESARAIAGLERWKDARRGTLLDLYRGLFSPAMGGVVLWSFELLLIWATWSYLRRNNARIVATSVRRLCRLHFMEGQFGRVVRWAGLVQAILPALLLLVAARGTLILIGSEAAEAQLLAAVGLPIYVYWLGRRVLLGLTRQITRGRPPLLPMHGDTAAGMRASYDRLAAGVVPALAVEYALRATLGLGRIVTLTEVVLFGWIALWLVIEAFAWREWLGRAWSELLIEQGSEGREAKLAAFVERSRIGALLVPVATVRLASTRLGRALSRSSLALGAARSLRTRWLRRAIQRGSGEASELSQLPEDYRACFPLFPLLGDEGAVIIRRDEVAQQALERLKRWRTDYSEGSLVIVGEKGIGKTTLANLIAHRLAADMQVTQLTLRDKPLREEELLAQLCPALELPTCGSVDALANSLCEGPTRVVFIDEAHNIFLRLVDGYRAYDALVKLVGASSKNVFWVLLFNSFTWQFLQASRAKVHSLRTPLQVPRWRTQELQQLLLERHQVTGYALGFDEILLSEDRSLDDGLELVAEADGYFRLLSELSGGNPRVATRLWLASLRTPSEKAVRVGLFRDHSEGLVRGLSDELLFALAAICQHENLTSTELARVLNLSEDFARYAMRHLAEAKLIELKTDTADRFALASNAYPSILRILRSKHLIFE